MNFDHVLGRHRRRDPDRPALIWNGRPISYAELDDRVSQLAHGLLELGVGPGDRIATLLDNCPEFVEVYFATMRVGGCLVPVNARLAAPEVEYCLRHSGARLVVSDGGHAEVLSAAVPSDSSIDVAVVRGTTNRPGWLDYEALFRGGPAVEPADVGMDAVQRIMYTSGTTAMPKGVMLTHGQVWLGAASRSAEFGLDRSDVSLTVGPLYHVGGLDTFTTVMLYLGATTVLHARYDPAVVLADLHAYDVSNCWLAPSMLARLLDMGADPRAPARLKVLLIGGEKASTELLRRLSAAWPAVGLYDAYGLTECQGMATFLGPSDIPAKLGTVGRAMLLREVRVVAEDGTPAPTGSAGEIEIRGPMVSPGYYRDPVATEESRHDGWLRTGDIGSLDAEGFLSILDRKKDMIRSGAENVASSEIERVLLMDDDVVEAAVVALPDQRWGEVPAAFVVSRSGVLDEARLQELCAQHLAKFKRPKVFMTVDSLPRTASGKVRKAELRDRLAAGDLP